LAEFYFNSHNNNVTLFDNIVREKKKGEVRWSDQYFCRTLVEAFQVHNRSGRSSCEGVEKEGHGYCGIQIISEIKGTLYNIVYISTDVGI
jgi:hypothetical protein